MLNHRILIVDCAYRVSEFLDNRKNGKYWTTLYTYVFDFCHSVAYCGTKQKNIGYVSSLMTGLY
jgi:hypothetical protein